MEEKDREELSSVEEDPDSESFEVTDDSLEEGPDHESFEVTDDSLEEILDCEQPEVPEGEINETDGEKPRRKISEMTPAEIGKRGEDAAAAYLKHNEYEILERNWSCPAGEADIIARDGWCLVFCEVKTRTDISKGLPSEAVNAEKRARYEKIAAWYIRECDLVDIPIRFDVIGLLVAGENSALMRHYINAFGRGF